MTDGTATPPAEEEAAEVQVRWKLNVKSELRRPFRKLFIVGLDGSDLSFQAVRFASQLADEYRDNVLIVTLTKSDDDDATFVRSEATATQIAMHYGTPHMRIAAEAIRIPEDWTYADGLVYLANHTENGSAVICLGAAGKGDMDRAGPRPSGQPPMGGIALAVMRKSKVPVLLIKNGPTTANFESDVLRSQTRVGRDGQQGLRMMACIDGRNALARSALDTAALFLRSGDSLYAYHVLAEQTARQTSELEQEFGPECAKLGASLNLAESALVKGHKTATSPSVREMIGDFADAKQVDVLIMGSAQLSNPAKAASDGSKHFLGSVATAVTKTCHAHVIIVKSFPTTLGKGSSFCRR